MNKMKGNWVNEMHFDVINGWEMNAKMANANRDKENFTVWWIKKGKKENLGKKKCSR
jgi:hypothetical protein